MGFTPSTGFGRAMACCGAQALVPGDGVERSAGNLVPTDARVLAATDFSVNQAALTGEAFPVEKQVDDTPAEVPGLLGARHAVFMGSGRQRLGTLAGVRDRRAHRARPRVEQVLDGAGAPSTNVFELAWLNSHFETGLKAALGEAILEHGEPDASAWRKLDEVPFDFERRRVSVLLERNGERLLVVKGAPEEILRLSVAVEDAAGTRPRAGALPSAAPTSRRPTNTTSCSPASSPLPTRPSCPPHRRCASCMRTASR